MPEPYTAPVIFPIGTCHNEEQVRQTLEYLWNHHWELIYYRQGELGEITLTTHPTMPEYQLTPYKYRHRPAELAKWLWGLTKHG